MKQFILNTIFIFLYSFVQIFPQEFSPGSPEWLVDKYFHYSKFSDKQKYFIGEMSRERKIPTIGEKLEGKGEVYFHQIQATNNECVFAVQIYTDGQAIDFYCYLTKQKEGWKIRAIRSFQLPDFLFNVLDSLSNLGSFSPADSSLYQTIYFFVLNDDELNDFLNNHLNELNDVVKYFNLQQTAEVDKELKALGCSAVFLDKKYPGCIFIQIAAFKKTEAGFIYTSESAKLPVISEKKFIYIEEVVTGWYVYRIM